MAHIYNLAGCWDFALDQMGSSISEFCYENPWLDTIELPGTTALGKKGNLNKNREIGHLTELYPFLGNAWFHKEVMIDSTEVGNPIFIYLERTRITKLWINGVYVSTQNSLCTPHYYDITAFVSEPKISITILVNNKDYQTKGGHLTSPDTQTNWNGIIGKLELQVKNKTYVKEIFTYPSIETNSVTIKSTIVHTPLTEIKTTLSYYGDLISLNEVIKDELALKEQEITLVSGNNYIEYTYIIGDTAQYWSEYNPVLYDLYIHICESCEAIETQQISRNTNTHTTFGLRKFHTDEHYFYINHERTFLRGKHDGLIFPLTGAAPTSTKEWLRILQIAKDYGINHYRFHTCCPPEAAFDAADLLGIYMEPELPFWGTITTTEDEGHKEDEFQFLVKEGERMLKTFGNHPSFVMMSLGNELWGSKEKLAEILRSYKAQDSRHLYTQGCNNFQWVPVILEEDDFFVGVRFTIDRQIRGSYATCDVPLGFVQTQQPNTSYDYDPRIIPEHIGSESLSGEIDIQYGTGTKRVTADQTTELIPNKPVISHEIGQYASYPNFKEIEKYTGVLRARNFEVFRDRLEQAGMLALADKFFYSSGKLSAQCYKLELEAAHRSRYLAGYQILDLQDFSGQGTALVGILDAFMDSKGFITPEEWTRFCSDTVIMAKFEQFNYTSLDELSFELLISDYRPVNDTVHTISWNLKIDNNTKMACDSFESKISKGVNSLGLVSISLPKVSIPTKMILTLEAVLNQAYKNNSKVENQYEFWVYPSYEKTFVEKEFSTLDNTLEISVLKRNERTLYLVHSLEDAKALLEDKQRVLLIPEELKKDLEGFYCTDFWCYPMFRSISESVNKPIPVGTMGLYIETEHPALKDFPCECYSTPQWYEIVTASHLAILDGLDCELQPIVQMIDNFERNHKLGLLFEANILGGSLLVCTSKLQNILEHPEVKQFARSIINYGLSDDFKPNIMLDYEKLNTILV